MTLLTRLTLLGVACMFAASAWAGRPVNVYEATVRAADQAAAAQEAMREVLVRATGRKDAAGDPAFATLETNAAQYVRDSRPGADGSFVISFDDAAVERQIVAAGRSVWDANRPFTLVVLTPPPTGPADDETRRELEQAAELRGLPVALVPMPVTDQTGNPLSADVQLVDARRLGADAVLLGRADSSSQSGQWQWTLITGLKTQSWDGPLGAGVDGAADALASVGGSALPLEEQEALVRVSGVGTLADYAAVERTLGELPGVRRSGIEEAEGAMATFRVLIRGGSQAISRALMGSQHFTPVDVAASSGGPPPGDAGQIASGAPLAFEYHP